MQRRDFSGQLAGACLGLAMTGRASAQGTPEEGKQYVRLQTAAPVMALVAPKKVEVVEFFWYGCPHCFAFEPMVQDWARRLPADVAFRQLPFAFIGPVEHQKLFYALEEIGQREALQKRLFNAIHVDHKRLNTEAEITDFVAANGVDRARFSDAYRSFAVSTKLSRGKQLANAYKIDSVPAIGVQGRFFTSATLTGTHERALTVTDYLIQRARQNA